MPSPLLVLIDNSITNLKILERLAASLGDGAAAETFRAAAPALEFCRRRRADLVAIAGETAEGEAAQFIPLLHGLPGCGELPVVVIAPYEDRDCIDRALAAGAADHLLSPVDHHEFRTRVNNLLRLRRRAAPPPPVPEPEPDSRVVPWAERAPRGALPEAHERLLRVLDAVPALICATGGDGRYVFVNRHFAEFTGARARQLVGRRPEEAHDDPFARRLAEDDARLLAGTIPAGAFEAECETDGGRRIFLTSKSLLHGDGEDAMVVTALIDITERKAAETGLRAAKEEAELANRSKTEFLANMSHELRTPLNAIIGFSQVMAGEMLGPLGGPKYIGYARDIFASAEHLLGIINDVLDVSRMEAGKLDLAEEAIEVGRAAEDLLQLVEAKARAAEIRLTLHRDERLPRLLADPRKFKQILLNLVTNAIKFSHSGGEVEIVLRQAAGALTIAVSDHGIGMDAAEIGLATSRFGQVASAWSRRQPGTGLGLPLAAGLVELHGGSLDIHSVKGVGTTVTVTFPPERSEAPPTAAASAGRAARA